MDLLNEDETRLLELVTNIVCNQIYSFQLLCGISTKKQLSTKKLKQLEDIVKMSVSVVIPVEAFKFIGWKHLGTENVTIEFGINFKVLEKINKQQSELLKDKNENVYLN